MLKKQNDSEMLNVGDGSSSGGRVLAQQPKGWWFESSSLELKFTSSKELISFSSLELKFKTGQVIILLPRLTRVVNV